MIHLILVRHGESVWHTDNRYAGSSDIGLTPRGYKDAEILAQWAKSAQLDALWTSSLSRARETAAAVTRATGLSPYVDARLREIDFGQGEGHTTTEMQQLFPESLNAFQSDPVTHHLPGGEDPHAAVARALACFHAIEQLYPNGKVLVVAHNTLIRLALCSMLGIPLERYRNVLPGLRNCTLTEVRLDGDESGLLSFNAPIPLQDIADTADTAGTLASPQADKAETRP